MRFLDRPVRAGVNRDARAFDRADIAEPIDVPIDVARVLRVIVLDPLDEDRRRRDDRDRVIERAGVAGLDAIREILRKADLAGRARRHPAGGLQIASHHCEGFIDDRFVDRLAVGRREAQQHRVVVADAANLGRHVE